MYQVIARKYRPQTFAELAGQEHVRATLENAIAQNRIAHGYILAGQRGTGKTTVARILARCLNCVQGPTATPCGQCSSCLEITQGAAPDVIEIDAASNRGINEMRELRENVRYRPSRDRFKVFIIDEAHQITSEAFNALLKTLEEPPGWVVFILCTTEAHKIPTTISSRCQQFSFRSVDFSLLVDRMAWICAQEGISADPEALAVLAQAGEGSVRDSLSALDQAIACFGTSLTGPQVRDLLGLYSLESLSAVTAALQAGSTSAMLDLVAELEATGKNHQHFTRELARYFRNLLVAKIAGGPTRLIAASPAEQARIAQTAALFSEEDLTRWLQLTLDLYAQLQYSLQPRLHLELGLIRLVHAARLVPIEEALKSLSESRASVSAPRAPASGLTRPRAATSEPRAATPGPRASAPAPAAPRAPAAAPASSNLKSALLAALDARNARFAADAVRQSELVESGGAVEFRATRTAALGLRSADIERALSEVLGRPVKPRITVVESPAPQPAPAPSQENDSDEATERALANPEVQRFRETFPEARIGKARDLKE
jgi:DNA polymerase-3 subunit gamma/tau